MEYSYYPGCSLTVTNKPYDLSTRAVARALSIEMRELEDWNCCGATAYMSVRELSSFIISARNLALAQKTGGADLVTVCNACFTVLNKANRYMAENLSLREKITDALGVVGMHYDGTVRVRHFLDVLVNDVGRERIESSVRVRLEGLRVAPYYGCQLSRPYGTFDDPEFPMRMDNLFSWLGAEVVPYPVKAKCCGGMLVTTAEEVGLKLVHGLLTTAAEFGADCIATACPLCQLNLEAYQTKIGHRYRTSHCMPIIYFTQVLGVALGCTPQELGLGMELVPATGILARYGGGGE